MPPKLDALPYISIVRGVSRICESLKDQRIFFFYEGSIYIVRSLNESEFSRELTIESISNFAEKHNFNDVKRIFERDYEGLTDNLDIRVFLDGLCMAFCAYFKLFLNSNNLILDGTNADPEFFLRFVFAKIPVDECGVESDPLVSIVDLFNNIDQFFYLISHAIIMAFSPANYSQNMRHRKDNFSNHVLQTASGAKWTTTKMIYCTGLFYSTILGSKGGEIFLPIPKKVRLGIFLDPPNRLRLFGQANFTTMQLQRPRENKLSKFSIRAQQFELSTSITLDASQAVQDDSGFEEYELQSNGYENLISSIREQYHSRNTEITPASEPNDANFGRTESFLEDDGTGHNENSHDDMNELEENISENHEDNEYEDKENETEETETETEGDKENAAISEENKHLISAIQSTNRILKESEKEIEESHSASDLSLTPRSARYEFLRKLNDVLTNNSIVNRFKSQIMDCGFDSPDFEENRAVDTTTILIELAGISPNSATRMFKIIQTALHSHLSQEY